MTFRKADWIYNTNVYEVNLRQYTAAGTINAFAQELPRLKDMGIQTLWFMPITPISEKNRKGSMGSYYACSDYTAVAAEFGTLADFKKLVIKAHEMGFKVILDWVANHTGWDHRWTTEHPDYYKWDHETNDFKKASGMDDIIELNFQHPNLREAMIEAMRFWITECDIDGFRCDLAFWVELNFWIEARASLEKTKTIFWLAESDSIENPAYYDAFDACYTWQWMRKIEDFYKGNSNIPQLIELLRQYDGIGGSDAIKLWFTTNHDENSWNGTEYEKYGDAAKALAVFSCTWNGIPLVYSGQELPNKKRLEFFEKDVIQWNGKYELHGFYKALLDLKYNHPALRTADNAVTTYLIETSHSNNVLAFLRRNVESEVLVLLNLSNEKVDCGIKDEKVWGTFTELFKDIEIDFPEDIVISLKPWDYRVYVKW
ncbi:MAG: alpha-amylase family glycosyl hydrolase [Ferruginibacter sp.]